MQFQVCNFWQLFDIKFDREFEMILPLLVLSISSAAFSVRSCYYCADYSKKCELNDKSTKPIKQNCENFALNAIEPIEQYFVEPFEIKIGAAFMYSVPLDDEHSLRKMCVKLTLRRQRSWLLEVDQIPAPEHYDPITFQSCMYNRFADYPNPCLYFKKHVFIEAMFETLDCTRCYTRDCNSAQASCPCYVIFLGLMVMFWDW